MAYLLDRVDVDVDDITEDTAGVEHNNEGRGKGVQGNKNKQESLERKGNQDKKESSEPSMKIKDLKHVTVPPEFDPEAEINSICMAKNVLGQTILVHAIIGAHMELFTVLIETSKHKNGCNLNTLDFLERTPLDYAIAHKDKIGFEILKMLIQAGASLQTMSKWYRGRDHQNIVPSTVLDILLENNSRLQNLLEGKSTENLQAALLFLSDNEKLVFKAILCQCEPEIAKQHICSPDDLVVFDAALTKKVEALDLRKCSVRARDMHFWDRVKSLAILCLGEAPKQEVLERKGNQDKKESSEPSMKIKDLKHVTVPPEFDPEAEINSFSEANRVLGQTLLTFAVIWQKQDLITVLIENSKQKNGCNLNAVDSLNRTPLDHAVRRKDIIGFEILKMLIQAGASLQTMSKWYRGNDFMNTVSSTVLDIVLEENSRLQKLLEGKSSENLQAALAFLTDNEKLVFKAILCQCEPVTAEQHIHAPDDVTLFEAFSGENVQVLDLMKCSVRERNMDFWGRVVSLGIMCLKEMPKATITNGYLPVSSPLIFSQPFPTMPNASDKKMLEDQAETISNLEEELAGKDAIIEEQAKTIEAQRLMIEKLMKQNGAQVEGDGQKGQLPKAKQ